VGVISGVKGRARFPRMSHNPAEKPEFRSVFDTYRPDRSVEKTAFSRRR
jgi:hypothetical protein